MPVFPYFSGISGFCYLCITSLVIIILKVQVLWCLKYDDNRATQIDIEKGKVTDKWTYVYTQGENGAWVKAVASLNGKEQFTITREITPAE